MFCSVLFRGPFLFFPSSRYNYIPCLVKTCPVRNLTFVNEVTNASDRGWITLSGKIFRILNWLSMVLLVGLVCLCSTCLEVCQWLCCCCCVLIKLRSIKSFLNSIHFLGFIQNFLSIAHISLLTSAMSRRTSFSGSSTGTNTHDEDVNMVPSFDVFNSAINANSYYS